MLQRITLSIAACCLALGGCASMPASAPTADAQATFYANLQSLCGKTVQGRAVAFDPALDASFASEALIMGPVDCTGLVVAIPFAVGADRSRTWVITQDGAALKLTHVHAHGGIEDALSGYGGATIDAGTSIRQQFPADAFSRALFEAQGRAVSVANVWAIEIEPTNRFAYELRRPNRFFRIEFNLSER
jgi:hypothetical protein